MTSPVTAGIDGSTASLAAAEWAAQEALLRGCRLRLVHGLGRSSARAPVTGGPAGATRRAAEELLRETRERLLARHPELDVGTGTMAERPVPALLDLSRESQLLVLGSCGLGAVTDFLLGSVSSQTAARAGCPVVLVRAWARGHRRDAGQGHRVVLGLKKPDEPDRVVMEFAFGAAATRGMPLHVVHAWKPPMPPSSYEPVLSVAPELEVAVAGAIADAVRPWRAGHPGVTVTETSAAGAASQVLVREAHDAALAVVGRGRRRVTGSRVGPVVHALLHRAGCPVAVVPHP